MTESVMELAYSVLRYGPAFLLWGAILFWRAQLTLRRIAALARRGIQASD